MGRRRLQWQLTTDICLAIGLLTLLFLVFDYVSERVFLNNEMAKRPEANAQSLKDLVDAEETPEGRIGVVEAYAKFLVVPRHGQGAAVALYDEKGNVLFRSIAPRTPLPDDNKVLGAMARESTEDLDPSSAGLLIGFIMPLRKSGGEDEYPEVVGALYFQEPVESIEGLAQRIIVRRVAAYAVMAVVLVIVIAVQVHRLVVRPLRGLIPYHYMASKGDFRRIHGPPPNNEFADLYSMYDKMIDELEKYEKTGAPPAEAATSALMDAPDPTSPQETPPAPSGSARSDKQTQKSDDALFPFASTYEEEEEKSP